MKTNEIVQLELARGKFCSLVSTNLIRFSALVATGVENLSMALWTRDSRHRD